MKDSQNPYLTAREYAHLSRSEASAWLPCSESSIKEYENGTRPVPEEIVLEMVKLYKTPWLRVQHLMKNEVFCDLFGIVPPSQSRAMSVLKVQKEVGDVVDAMPSIVNDTVMGNNLSTRLIRECREACTALMVLIGLENKETASAGTETESNDNRA